MQTLITGGIILTPDQILKDHNLVIDDEKILSITSHTPTTLIGYEIIDVKGFFVVPGFIDIHVHGAVGSDTMDATSDAIHGMGDFFSRHGVTSFLPTTVAASARDIQSAIKNASLMPRSTQGARHLGIHLEGPYLSDEFRGAQPHQHLRPADFSEYKSWFENKKGFLAFLAKFLPDMGCIVCTSLDSAKHFV